MVPEKYFYFYRKKIFLFPFLVAEVMNSVASMLNLDVTATGINGKAFESVADIATETSEKFDKYMAGK